MKDNYIIRPENEGERREVENLVRTSFWNVYRPGALEHYVLHTMRDCDDFVDELNYVLVKDDVIIGQNVFVRTFITLDSGDKLPILTMGPICIAPEYKRQGWGKILLDYCLERATEQGYKAVCLEGNYDFYSHCGFTYAHDYHIRYHRLPEGEDDNFFLCRELKEGYLDGVSGEYATPACYMVDQTEAEEYDATFPPLKKEKLPGQLFS